MNIYIFPNIDNLTGHFHSSGGAVVIAQSIERAVKLLKEQGEDPESATHVSQKEMQDAIVCPLAGEGNAERAFVFPDAGCC